MRCARWAVWAAARGALCTLSDPPSASVCWGAGERTARTAQLQDIGPRIRRTGGQAGLVTSCTPLPSDPGAPLWGVFRGSEPVGPGIRGMWGKLGSPGGAALMTRWPLELVSPRQGTPGALGWRRTWMPECWPGRVPLCPPSLCQAARASGQRRRGQEGRVSPGCS